MKYLSLCLCLLLLTAPLDAAANNIHRQNVTIPETLHAPLASVVRMSTGLHANKVCNQLSADEKASFAAQMQLGLKTLFHKLVNDAGVTAAKSERILRQLMEEGEKMAEFNYPTCTNSAPDIIVKATQDADCINLYLAGKNTSCFR